MKMHAFLIGCLVAGIAWAGLAPAAPIPKNDPRPKTAVGPEFIRKVLDGKTNLEFTNTHLPGVLNQLSEDHGINFVLDKSVIQQMGFEPTDLMVDVKIKEVKLRNGLRTMLNQFNLTLAIVGDTVLVTTEEQAIYKQLKHRISVDYDSVPLHKAIKELSQNHAINVVIDPRTLKTKAAETPVTLNVDDVPFEAVIRIMCEIAGLKPARMGNVIFITTEDRAERLRDSDSLVPLPGTQGASPAPQVIPAAPLPPPIAPAPAPAADGKIPRVKE
jgi:hypothetical protein